MKNYPIYEIKKFNCNSLQDDVYINTFKHHLSTHSFIEKSHSHDFFLLVLFTEGFGKHTIDFETYSIKPGSTFLLQPGQIHSWELSQDIDGYIFFYTREYYNLHFATKRIDQYSFFNSVKSNPEINLNQAEIKAISLHFKQLISENKSDQIFKKDKIILILDLILIELARKYWENETHESNSYLHKTHQFETLLEKNFKEKKAPSYYADMLHVSLKHLNRICKEVLGKTVTEIIRKRVVLEAKRMLSLKQFTISEIANELGFDSNSYFAKTFKKETGISPKEFSKKNN